MQRNGVYTVRRGPLRQLRYSLHRKWRSFRRLSKKQQIAIVAIPVLVFLVVTPLATYAYFARDISDPERLMNRGNTGVQLIDIHDQVFYSTGHSKPLTRLPLSQISDSMEKALISSEDKNFYKHSGISWTGLLAAIYANIMNRDATAYGGSTLTQQLVKNTLLSTDKNFLRKYQELSIAIAVDRTYTKDEILDMYLNSVYYGEGAFGIDEAAKVYFNKSAADLTLGESSMLVGILPAPSAYSPISGDPAKAKRQQERVLRRMLEDGKITAEQKVAAEAEVLAYAPPAPEEKGVGPHFAEMVISELNDKYGEERVRRSGYRVKTTLDKNWQQQAEQIVADQTAINAARGGRNAAMVAIDPKNGEIRALVGSADYDNDVFGKVNMATEARQPGSSFKPIYYTEAIAKGLVTPGTIMKDEATDFGGYKPNNYDFKFRGDITIRNALSQSLNIPAVEVMQKLGVSNAIAVANRMGISTITNKTDYGLALALGAGEAKPLEMTNAYAAFANGGMQYQATTIKSIENKFGDTIYKYKAKSKRVQSEAASFLISDILSDNTARAPTFGSSLNLSGRKAAVKTGSTDDNRDAWTIGFTPSIAIGVWVGNNENEVMQSGGSAFAGPIWRKSMQAFLAGTPSEDFKRPSGVEQVSICRSNGLRATGNDGQSTYQEYFINGTAPTKTCTVKQQPQPQQEEENTQPQTKDSDGDGVIDSLDKCSNTPSGVTVDATGCTVKKDSDNDGVTDDKDKCPATPTGVTVDSKGCPVAAQTDTDNDGVVDSLDQCPGTAAGVAVDSTGCPATNPPGGGGGQGAVLPPPRFSEASSPRNA
jgi:penicillin-binding protein 1A